MFANKKSQNKRLYRYPSQPVPQCQLNATNILKEVTNSYENVNKQKGKQRVISPKTSQESQISDQKENIPQHNVRPSVVIKNINQNYNSMIDVMAQYTNSNCNSFHSHSNSNGSTVSHVRSVSDADSVVFLGPEDTSSNGGITSSNNLSSSQSSWREIQVKSPECAQQFQLQQLKLQQQQQMQISQKSESSSALKSQKNSNESKGDDTFNLSVSNELITIPTVLSESQNLSFDSVKQNKIQIQTTAPTGNTNENEITNITTNQNTPRNQLYVYCQFCKGLTQAEVYQIVTDQRFKSGMMTIIIEFVCCMNNKSSLKKKKSIGLRCQQCKQIIAKVGSPDYLGGNWSPWSSKV